MGKIKAYIIWLYKIRPILRYRNKASRRLLLKIQLKKYTGQSPVIEPFPYNRDKLISPDLQKVQQKSIQKYKEDLKKNQENK